MSFTGRVSGVVLGAGLSSRMGRFKLTLPWRDLTVIQQVVNTLAGAGIDDVIVVLGHRADEVRSALAPHSIRTVLNDSFADGSMLTSIRTGLAAVGSDSQAALLCLGDQPQMLVESVRAVVEDGAHYGWREIIIPSYNMRAGHPILLPRSVWPSIMEGTGTLRDVLRKHRDLVRYLVLDTPTILADLDTPEDYARAQEQLDRGEA